MRAVCEVVRGGKSKGSGCGGDNSERRGLKSISRHFEC